MTWWQFGLYLIGCWTLGGWVGKAMNAAKGLSR